MYPIEIKTASSNGWFTPQQAKNYYGRYSREGITIHWWNSPELAGTHDSTVNYILNQAKAGNKSVNYVLSDSKITEVVSPDNVAWASETGNPTTVSIECDPRLTAEGYKKVGWLINELEKRYSRSLTLYPHKHWVPSTTCPGNLDLNRMRDEANNFKQGSTAMSADTTIRQVFEMGLDRQPDPGALTTYRATTDAVLVNSVYTSQERALNLKAKADRLSSQNGLIDQLNNSVKQLQSNDQADASKIAELTNEVQRLTSELQKANDELINFKSVPTVIVPTETQEPSSNWLKRLLKNLFTKKQ